jgi:hypothetical protein
MLEEQQLLKAQNENGPEVLGTVSDFSPCRADVSFAYVQAS